MIRGLERFVQQLRAAGIDVSPAEWLDALRAAAAVGLADRARFRRAIAATVVKRADQQALYASLFDAFFAAPPALRPRGRGVAAGSATAPGGRSGQAGDGTGRAPRSRRPVPPERPPAERRAPDSPRPPTPAPARAAAPVAALVPRAGRRNGRLRQLRLVPAEEAAAGREAAAGLRGAAQALRHRDLTRAMAPADERLLLEALPRIVDRIRLGTSRRLRRASRGRLHLRRVFRDNLAHDGVPWILPRRRLAPRRARIVLLIDVSWSAARAAGLFLALAAEFLRRARQTRVLLFVDQAIDATAAVEAWWASGGGGTPGSFGKLVATLGGLDSGAPSDYGRTFDRLVRSPVRPRGRDTLLVVLGDGRTNRFDPQVWAFETLAAGCGGVLWLVPEAAERWGRDDSALPAYLPHADVAVETRDLAGLARGVTELVRRL